MVETRTGPMTEEALVAGYLRYQTALREDDPDAMSDPSDPDEAAFDAIDGLVRRGPAAAAWMLVVELLRRTPDDKLGVQAAGVLEDLVRRHGAELVDAIEAEAAADERFRWALSGIWLSVGALPPSVVERLVAASGGRIKPL